MSYVVTGASRGIGFEFVRQLSAKADNKVFGIVRDRKTSANLEKLAKERPNVHILQADITDSKALKVAAEDVSKITGGKLDLLINNAALVQSDRQFVNIIDYDEELLKVDFHHNLDVNVLGIVYTTNAFLPLLRKGSLKKVATLSSGIGEIELTLASGLPSAVPYCVSKAAVNMVVAKYAVALRDEGFTFLSISPGVVNTATRAPTEEELEGFKAMGGYFARVSQTFKGPMEPQESVLKVLDVIEKNGVENSGAFISHNGNKDWF